MAQDQDPFEDDVEDDASGVTDGGSPAPESDGESPKERKRFQDAQAALHKEQARARELEAELAKAKAKGSEAASTDRTAEAPEVNPELLEDWREAAWERYPAFKELGVEIDAIQGGSRTEIRQSAANLAKFIGEVETKVRNRVLAEYGLAADGLGGARQAAPDFTAMTDEEFLKYVNGRGR